MVEEIAALELRERLDTGFEPLLLDVRESWEYALAQIPHSLHLPMGEVPARVEELPRDRPLVVICHHGVRSLQVAHYLQRAGFSDIYNLSGGIDAWARQVDPDVPLY